jgi:hypothetical protein
MALGFDVTINARGQLDYGLYGYSVDGFGVVTYGFVWSCGSIWDVGDEDVTTTWTDCSSPSSVEDCTE